MKGTLGNEGDVDMNYEVYIYSEIYEVRENALCNVYRGSSSVERAFFTRGKL